MTTRITVEVTDERLAEVLCSACEGGSGYWAKQDDGKESPYRFADVGGRTSIISHLPGSGPLELVPDFDVAITDFEDSTRGTRRPKKHRLTPAKLRRGLQVMAEKYPKHFADVVTGNGDSTTGDVLLQCALFGELVYG